MDKSIEIVTDGRTDLEGYFKLSGIRECKRLQHNPFLVFLVKDKKVTVVIIDRADELLAHPPETKVMAQWGGKYRSDFFQFTVGDFQKYIQENPKESYHNV